MTSTQKTDYIKTQTSSTHILHAEEVGNGVVSDHEMWVWSELCMTFAIHIGWGL